LYPNPYPGRTAQKKPNDDVAQPLAVVPSIW
jgi:hypothetical protein